MNKSLSKVKQNRLKSKKKINKGLTILYINQLCVLSDEHCACLIMGGALSKYIIIRSINILLFWICYIKNLNKYTISLFWQTTLKCEQHH